MLFQMEVAGADPEETIVLFWRNFGAEVDLESRAYADELVRGTWCLLEELDAQLAVTSTHWRLERMARVDRNILRIGAWELAHKRDVPRAVVLDEAVELAKAFGTDESSAFVNGVLNALADRLGRSDDERR
jgi:N utilization substance protein B